MHSLVRKGVNEFKCLCNCFILLRWLDVLDDDHVTLCDAIPDKLLSFLDIRLNQVVIDLVHDFAVVVSQFNESLLRMISQERE